MTEQQILDGVRQGIAKQLKLDLPLELSTDVQGDLSLDSIQRLTLVVELENHFRICFDPGEAEGVSTLGDVVRLIRQQLEPVDAAVA